MIADYFSEIKITIFQSVLETNKDRRQIAAKS